MRRLIEDRRQACDTNRYSWLEDRVQTRGRAFDLELERSFADGWTVLCERSSVLAEPYSYWMDEIGGKLVLVWRGDDGQLRGYYNVCPHQGAPLTRERRGIRRALACPYHGFVFDAKGTLRSLPLDEGYDGAWFRRDDYPLRKIGIAEIGTLTLGNLHAESSADPLRPPLREHIEALFAPGQTLEVISRFNIALETHWADWFARSKKSVRNGSGIFGSEHAGVTVTERTLLSDGENQGVLLRALRYGGLSGAESWGADAPQALKAAGWAGCLLHLMPNSVIAALDGALVTLRADPIDETGSLLWVTAYGSKDESGPARQRRLRQIQLWWGPYGLAWDTET